MADDKQTHINTDRARAGATPHMTRVILPVSMVLIIALFAYIILA